MSKKLHQLRPQDLRRLLREAEEQGHGRSVKQRLHWLLFATEHSCNISLTCRHFAIARSTFLRWLERFNPKDLSSLSEASRAPRHVRLPETPKNVVALIRTYREEHQTMGKESIRQLLQKEHGISISASTVGRVISRNNLFFSETSSHQLKIRAWALTEGKDLPKEKDDESESPQEKSSAPWFGPGLSVILLAIGLGGSIFVSPKIAHADESASYKLTTEAPNEAEGTVAASNSYAVQGGVSWYSETARSTSFQIADDVPASSSSSSASSQTSSAPSSPSVSGGHVDGNFTTNSHSGTTFGGQIFFPHILPVFQPAPPTQPALPSTLHPSAPAKPNPVTQAGKALLKFIQARQKARMMPTGTNSSTDKFRLLFQGRASEPLRNENMYRTRNGALQMIEDAASVLGLGTLLPLCNGRFAPWFLLLLIVMFGVGYAFGSTVERWKQIHTRAKKGSKKQKAMRYRRIKLLVMLLLSLVVLLIARSALAAASVPNMFVYKGHLLTSAGTPVTTAHNIRFSFWKSTDFVAGDVTGAGAINTSAPNYVSWNEVQTVTPDANGYFSLSLGSVTSLPDFSTLSAADLASLHLQVEVKALADPDTSYELLDINTSDSAIDRSPLLSVPFALNAALVDQHKTGTGAGNIPYLNGSAQLANSVIPGGTNADFFTIDADGSASTGQLNLNFGSTLGKKLSYDITNQRFNFNSSLRIQGNLTVTGSLIVNGLINGIDISSLTEATATHLKVSSGAGLSADIAPGNYRVNGSITNFAGQSGVSLQNNANNYLFFTSTGLTLNTGGFPTDKSFIPLAKVTTSGGAIATVTDRRVLQSDNRENAMLWVLHPDYEGSAYQGDGTNNVGQLSVANDAVTGKNYYLWSSTRATLQDYDIVLRVTLPQTFNHWNAVPLKMNYKTGVADAAQNKLDVTVSDTAGNPVTISGGTGLNSASWTTSDITFSGTPTWTAGGNILITLKASALSSGQVDIGDLELRYSELH